MLLEILGSFHAREIASVFLPLNIPCPSSHRNVVGRVRPGILPKNLLYNKKMRQYTWWGDGDYAVFIVTEDTTSFYIGGIKRSSSYLSWTYRERDKFGARFFFCAPAHTLFLFVCANLITSGT